MATQRKRLEARESRPHANKGKLNGIPNNSTVNDNTGDTVFENIIKNLDNLSNRRKQVQVVNGFFNETTLYIAVAGGVKRRNLYGARSKSVDSIKDIDSGNKIAGITKNTLAEYMILSGANNRPPMLDKYLYDSWKSRMKLYMQNREHRRMILKSVEHDLLIWITIKENGMIKTKKYAELSVAEEIQTDDGPIACLNKAMAFLIAVDSLRFPSTNNQLRTSSNLRDQTTIQDGKVIVQQVQGRQGQSYSATGYKSNATSSRGNNSSRQVRVVKCYNCQGVLDGQVVQIIIPINAAFQTEDLDTYDSDCDDISNAKATEDLDTYDSNCDDISNAKAVLMDNISNYDSDVISEEMIALKEQVDSLEKNLSKQIKEKECLLQTFTVFKSESKEKEDKYMENEIDLEKKIKKLDNILFKVGQFAQIVHMLTKPQAFYDNIHKQALGYQNSFHLKKAQRIKPTLYDGIVMSDKHIAI
nr:PDR ABC-type transporter family protein [Tanacetum cinerariifolium]